MSGGGCKKGCCGGNRKILPAISIAPIEVESTPPLTEPTNAIEETATRSCQDGGKCDADKRCCAGRTNKIDAVDVHAQVDVDDDDDDAMVSAAQATDDESECVILSTKQEFEEIVKEKDDVRKDGCCGDAEKQVSAQAEAAACKDGCCGNNDKKKTKTKSISKKKKKSSSCGDGGGEALKAKCTDGCCDVVKPTKDVCGQTAVTASCNDGCCGDSKKEVTPLAKVASCKDACCGDEKKTKKTTTSSCGGSGGGAAAGGEALKAPPSACADGCCDEVDVGKATKDVCGKPIASSCNDGCCDDVGDVVVGAKEKPLSSGASLFTTIVTVVGMTCTGCAQSLEKLLRGTRGVESADASFMGSRAVVVHDPTLIDSSAIAALMSKLNFVGTVSSSRSNDASGAGPATVVVALGSATNFEHLQSLKLPCVASARYDAANSRATIDVAESFKRRDVIDALAAAELPHELFDAAAAAAATSEAAEAREAMVWKIHLVLSIVIAIPLALIAFVFVDDVSQLVRVIVGFVLCSISQLRIGYPLYVSAYKSLRYVHEFNMDCLVMLSTTIAYVYSTIASIVWLAVDGADESVHVETYFETPAILLALIVIGRWLEKRAKHKTGQALRSIRGLQAPSATLIKDVGDDSGRTIDCALIDAGDLLRLVPGDRVPVDGVVVRGTTTVDEAMVTGESRPQVKQVDSKLIGGTSNIDGCVVMRAEAGVQESTVAQIVQLMSDAQDTKPSVQLLADKIASVFVPVIMVLALVVFGIWLALVYGSTLIEVEPNVNPAVFAMRFAIALLVVSCPCAVALAAPTVVVVAAGVAARHGLLLKNGESLERLHRVTDVLFDKTGTITRGELRVVAICAVSAKGRTKAVVPSDELDDASARLLDLCASAENGSEHSLARGIEASAKRHLPNWTARATSGFRAVPGQGVVCEIDGVGSVVVGTPQLLEAEAGVEVDEPLSMRRRLCEVAGDLSSTIVYVSVAGSLVGALALADTIRPEAAAVIKWLTERRRVRVWMVTGDNEHAATAMANVAGVANERVVAGVSPAGKAEHVRALQANGGVVCHVGDGVNDAVALTQADIGLAMSSGTDVASSAADIVLMKNDLRDVVVLLDLARAAVWRIRINLGWAFIYNLLAMPLAAGAFYPLGRVALEPGLAGASELLSSLPVVLCSVLLARYRPPSVATME